MCFTSFEEAEVLRGRAEAFLRNARRLLEERGYDLAAFSMEQCCQLLLKYKLLIKSGAYPRTHSVMRLLRELAKLAPEVTALTKTDIDVIYITKVEDAYIGARYLPRVYEESEVRELLRFLEERFKPIIEKANTGVESIEGAGMPLSNYREVAKRVKDIANAVLPGAKVFLFGSAASGKVTASSDIDLLIILNERITADINRLKLKVIEELGSGAPVELHVVTSPEFERWYKRFVEKLEEVA